MTVPLNPEQERVVGEAIRAGLIHFADEAVEIGIATLRQRLSLRKPDFEATDAEVWSRRLAAWVASHSDDLPLLSDEAIDRESIYGERGA
jgi:hypothetical protein